MRSKCALSSLLFSVFVSLPLSFSHILTIIPLCNVFCCFIGPLGLMFTALGWYYGNSQPKRSLGILSTQCRYSFNVYMNHESLWKWTYTKLDVIVKNCYFLSERFNIVIFIIPLNLVLVDKPFYHSIRIRSLNFEFIHVDTSLVFNLQNNLRRQQWVTVFTVYSCPVSQYMNSFTRILVGYWSCRVYEPSTRNSRRCWSTVGFYNWELLAQVCIFSTLSYVFLISSLIKLLSKFRKNQMLLHYFRNGDYFVVENANFLHCSLTPVIQLADQHSRNWWKGLENCRDNMQFNFRQLDLLRKPLKRSSLANSHNLWPSFFFISTSCCIRNFWHI